MLSILRARKITTPQLFLRRLEHTFSELPAEWRKLTVPKLEVMDTTELQSLKKLLSEEKVLTEQSLAIAKADRRKVLRVNCELDLKRIDKIDTWTDHVLKNPSRSW